MLKITNFTDYIYKKFAIGIGYKGGRNNLGRITIRHRVINQFQDVNMFVLI